MLSSFDKAVNQGRVERLRASQHTPAVTRVVLQVTERLLPPLEQLDEGEFILPLFSGPPARPHAYLARLQGHTEPELAEEPIMRGNCQALTLW